MNFFTRKPNTDIAAVDTTKEPEIEIKTRGRKPFAADSIDAFTEATRHLNFATMQKNEIFAEYQNWAETNNHKSVSYVTFSKFFSNFNGSGNVNSPSLVCNTLTLNQQFSLLKEYVGLVVDGILKSVYIQGEPGIGKTETVQKELANLNANYSYFGGGVKGSYELAKILYDNRKGKVIVFDDFDSIFKSKTQVDILKIALQDKDVRQITWVDGTKRNKGDKIPTTFEFTSSVIFISNRTRLDPAIKSRCKIMSFKATKIDILDYIKDNFGTFLTGVPIAIKMEVYEFMRQNINSLSRVDFRIFKFAVADRLLDMKSGITNGRWKTIILSNPLA